MNPKFKRVLSIIALICMGIFLVLLPLWLVFPKMFGNLTAAITLSFFAVAVLITVAIYASKGFPSQQVKEEERRKIEAEYYAALALEKKDAEERAQKEKEQKEKDKEEDENAKGSEAN